MENEEKYIYVVISTTQTKFGGVIRKLGNIKYNHTAIALDRDLTRMYSFARRKHCAVLTGQLVKESVARYTLNKTEKASVVVFRLPVTQKQYDRVVEIIDNIYNDGAYIYNLLSVLLYPVTRGCFSVYKAFTCIEFVMYVLNNIGFLECDKPYCGYKPDDMLNILSDYKIFEGEITDYTAAYVPDENYFLPLSMSDVIESTLTVIRLFVRLAI